jgi:hypothetical protein
MAMNAGQGNLTSAMIVQQGWVTSQGYKAQAAEDLNLQKSAEVAASAAELSGTADYFAAGMDVVGGVADML